MINLDQVRTLEWKVKQAVQLIVHLRRENDTLRGRISDTEVRLQELETLLESFKATQNEMESGIRSALEDLDNLEVGATPEPVAGPVDSLSYPLGEPAGKANPEFADEEREIEGGFAATDPAGIFEKASAPQSEVSAEPEVEAPSEPPAREPSFEEEYAALAAAEAEAEEAPAYDEPVPESVELEEGASSPEAEDEAQYLDPEPVVPEEKQPEQPGLGIF